MRCFVLARTAKQFHAHAEYQPTAARLTTAGYRKLLRAVLARSPRLVSTADERIRIPGFDCTHDFSASFPDLFRQEAGGAWRSYFQRGNWRMIAPSTRRGQRAEAARLAEAVRAGRAPVVHVNEFPRLRINHAVLFYDVEDTPEGAQFLAYDPNDPKVPVTFRFHRDQGFIMPPLPYYLGGPVKVYEVYRSWCR